VNEVKKSNELQVVAEGKTKILYVDSQHPSRVIVESKDSITANDDPTLTRQFASKGVSATTTTCRVFEALAKHGIPVAYTGQLSPVSFGAIRCKMIPLEVVIRRYLVGSYCKRHPETSKGEGVPNRVEPVLVEFYLKTTHGSVPMVSGDTYFLGLKAENGEEDPLIADISERTWRLQHAKKPEGAEGALLGTIASSLILEEPIFLETMQTVAADVFLVLENLWQRVGEGYHLLDLKIEFGLTEGGALLVADVVDNDSWRLRTNTWEELSKQLFRDGEVPLEEVEAKYALVALLSEQLPAMTCS